MRMSKVKPSSGNAFAVISAVAKRLRDEGRIDDEKKYRSEALEAKSYDELMQLSLEYVSIENWEMNNG